MYIKELFVKPIDRSINGVIKADQSDDASVWQELDEYVITKELDKHLRGFFNAYLKAIDEPNDPNVSGKVGVWVSGFFGSGKSHFIKILSYLLENRAVTHDGQSRRAMDFFQEKIEDTFFNSDIKRAISQSTDVILFNIDSKADGKSGRDAILKVFLNVFNEKIGYSSYHPHIAHMERYLDRLGKYELFKQTYAEETGASWVDKRQWYTFKPAALSKALSVALNETITDGQAWLKRFEGDFSLSVENLALWVKEYLDSKGSQQRLIFLVDEIGQFIGKDTHLMLSLQTIVENLGTVCHGRAWVVVTSQEDIDAVVGEELRAEKAQDFSKIQGRFKTRLSLSSGNVDEVIQKRLLHKTEAAESELRQIYLDKADILKHQLSFTNVGMTFHTYSDASNFAAVYPFAPYQFQLVQKVFESVRKAGATGLHLARGERSMLDAFQSAALSIADQSSGVLVPLYRFYPSIEGFLEGIVKSTIDNAETNIGLEMPFDSQLLKTLFLIRYVDEVKGNVDNLVTLFIEEIDAPRLDLRQKIEASLQRLEKQTLISRNGDDFLFLTNAERDIGREIKEVDVSSIDEAKTLGEFLFDYVLNGRTKHRYPANKKDFGMTRLCDLHPYGSRVDGDVVVSVITPLSEDYEKYKEAKCILESSSDDGKVVIRLDNDKTLIRELRAYIQTSKYTARKLDGTTPHATTKILNDRLDENRERRGRLQVLIDRLLREAAVFASGQKLNLKASSALTMLDESVNYLIKNSFPKLGFIEHLSANPDAEIRALCNAPINHTLSLEGGSGLANLKALTEVSRHVELLIQAKRVITIHSLIEERLNPIPYGWPAEESLLLIVRLVMMGELSLVMDNDTLSPDKIYAAVATPSKWRRIEIKKRQSIDKGILQKTRLLVKNVFGELAPDGEDGLFEFIKQQLRDWQQQLQGWKPLSETGRYPARALIVDMLGVINKYIGIADSFALINLFHQEANDWQDLSDHYHDLSHFFDKQRSTWERLHNQMNVFSTNRQELEKHEQAQSALNRMQFIVSHESPYNLIREVDGLIQIVTTVNQQLIAERQQHGLERIDAHIHKVQEELARVAATPEFSNKMLYPLQQLRKQVEQDKSIAHIYQAQSQARDKADAAIDLIEQEQERVSKAQKEAARVVKPVVDALEDTKQPYHQANVTVTETKKRRVVQPKELVSKSYLESQQDVDEFLQKLRTTLEAAITQNERVEIR
jgi:hypothetical protein